MGENSAHFNGQSIAPGQSYTFNLSLTAPSALGTYQTWWDMEHNGIIFGDNNAYVQITVASPGDNSKWVANAPYLTVNPGQQFTIYFTYLNDGTTTWSDAGGYKLGCDTFYHKESNCMGGNPVGFGGQSVGTGQQFTFTFTLTAPTSPGVYTTWWDMQHNGGIFGNNNSYIQVTVQSSSAFTQSNSGGTDFLWQDGNFLKTIESPSRLMITPTSRIKSDEPPQIALSEWQEIAERLQLPTKMPLRT